MDIENSYLILLLLTLAGAVCFVGRRKASNRSEWEQMNRLDKLMLPLSFPMMGIGGVLIKYISTLPGEPNLAMVVFASQIIGYVVAGIGLLWGTVLYRGGSKGAST